MLRRIGRALARVVLPRSAAQDLRRFTASLFLLLVFVDGAVIDGNHPRHVSVQQLHERLFATEGVSKDRPGKNRQLFSTARKTAYLLPALQLQAVFHHTQKLIGLPQLMEVMTVK